MERVAVWQEHLAQHETLRQQSRFLRAAKVDPILFALDGKMKQHLTTSSRLSRSFPRVSRSTSPSGRSCWRSTKHSVSNEDSKESQKSIRSPLLLAGRGKQIRYTSQLLCRLSRSFPRAWRSASPFGAVGAFEIRCQQNSNYSIVITVIIVNRLGSWR